jgi:23S rRNA (pseudouridine1915-N3)-methyltransferase
MKILFVSVGKSHDPLLRDSIEEFSSRISRHIQVEWKIIPSSKKDGVSGKKEEGDAINKIVSLGDFVVSLDERGKAFSSVDFADFFQKRLNDGAKRVLFIIGGSYGLHQDVLDKSGLILSLSKLTFPHQLVRLVIAEQVYRAFSITRGEKYHHE